MSTFTRLYSLDEIDFPVLFDASLAAMDAGTYQWPHGDMTAQEKQLFMRQKLTGLLHLPDAFGFSEMLDGVNVAAGVGLLRDGAFTAGLGFIQPDANGSRAFTYDQTRLDQWRQFLRDNGATRIRLTVDTGSAIYAQLPDRYDMAAAQITPSTTLGGNFVNVEITI